MRIGLWLAALLPTLASAQTAPLAPSAQGDLTLTIYANGQSLVEDVRQLSLGSGRIRQEFPDVSAQIRPETVTLETPDATIVEQNFDYDLLSPAALLEKSLGQTITIIRTNPGNGQQTTQQATVLAVNNGVVLRVGDRIETLGNEDTARLVFPQVPPNLRARPTLSVTLESARAGSRRAALRYLTPGLGWRADYVALWDAPKGTMDLQGWVTLTNTTGTTYTNAKLLLIAGNASVSGGGDDDDNGSVRTAGTESANRERVGDFYLYPMAERTTVADRQTKQVSFLDAAAVPAVSKYEYQVGWLTTHENPESARSVLRFTTSKQGGLGDAMPAGTVRIYTRDLRGQPQFLGENQVSATPMGSEVAITTGDAFDVKVKPVVEERTKLGPAKWRTRMSYTVTNAKPTPVTVDIAQHGLDWLFTDTRVTEQSIVGERRSADVLLWHVPVPANGETKLTATFETRF